MVIDGLLKSQDRAHGPSMRLQRAEMLRRRFARPITMLSLQVLGNRQHVV